MLTCRELARLVAEDRMHELSRMKRLEARFHFAMCVGCRRYRVQIERIGAAFRRIAEDDPGDEALLRELEDRILRRGSS